MSIHSLRSVVEPPATPSEVPDRPDWKWVEAHFGVALPTDYRNYVTTYGTGLLGHLIVVGNPFSRVEGFALPAVAELLCETLRGLRGTEGASQVPFGIHPERPGLLPWGGDENGNGLYWLTDGEPDSWPCLIGEGRGKRWERFEMPMTAFLAEVFRGEIRSAIWPRSFPGKRDRVFEPYRV